MTRLLILGGSDAGISTALRAREVDSTADVTVVLADRFPNYSICGLPKTAVAPNPDNSCATSFGNTDTEAAIMNY